MEIAYKKDIIEQYAEEMNVPYNVAEWWYEYYVFLLNEMSKKPDVLTIKASNLGCFRFKKKFSRRNFLVGAGKKNISKKEKMDEFDEYFEGMKESFPKARFRSVHEDTNFLEKSLRGTTRKDYEAYQNKLNGKSK